LTFILKLGTKALQDAGITYDKIEQAFVGYVYGKILFNFIRNTLRLFRVKQNF